MRLELPDGQWAELRAPRKVSERRRRAYIGKMTNLASATAGLPRNPNKPDEPDPAAFTGAMMALADAVGDALVICLVKEWSFGDVTVDVLGDMSTDCFDPLFKACRDQAGELLPDYSPDPDPKVLTGGSAD